MPFSLYLNQELMKRESTLVKFKANEIDLNKAAKSSDFQHLTYSDCKYIQEVTSDLDPKKIGMISIVGSDLLKWTTSMVQLKIINFCN